MPHRPPITAACLFVALSAAGWVQAQATAPATAPGGASAPSPGGPASASTDTAGPLAANAAFYQALNALFTGDTDPMSALWSHSGDVTYMGPLGEYLHGWDQVAESWANQAAMNLGGRVDPHEVRVVRLGPMAVVTNVEIGDNPRTTSGDMQVRIRATNVYRLEDGRWRMIHHHTDILPPLKQELQQMQK